MPNKKKCWIVYRIGQSSLPEKTYSGYYQIYFEREEKKKAEVKKNEEKFYYLHKVNKNYCLWLEDITQATEFTKPEALLRAKKEEGLIDYHPEFRYGW